MRNTTKFKKGSAGVLAFMLLLVPEVSSAAGLVPGCEGASCSACDLVSLGNNVLGWLIGVLMVVFALMLVWAGLGLVMSGGNPEAKKSAKSKLTNSLIGLVIVLASFLIVDTLMRALLSGEEGEISGYGPWSQVQCGAQSAVETIAQDAGGVAIPPPAGVDCSDVAGLITRFSGSPIGKVDSELTALISCYRADPAINAGLDTGQIYTVDRSYPICAATNGNPVCGSCSHSANSCHYGRGSGAGARGVDFNARGISEAALFDLIRARQPVCGGRLLQESNHTHISLNSC